MSPLPPNSLGPLTKPFGSRINSPDSELRYASALPDGYGISHQSQQILQCVLLVPYLFSRPLVRMHLIPVSPCFHRQHVRRIQSVGVEGRRCGEEGNWNVSYLYEISCSLLLPLKSINADIQVGSCGYFVTQLAWL